MNEWPTSNNGLFDKAIETLQTKGPRTPQPLEPRRMAALGKSNLRDKAIQSGATPAVLDLRSALDFACTETDLAVACAHVQASLGIVGEGMSTLHFDYLFDGAAERQWADLTEAERHQLLAAYVISEIMTFGDGPSMPSGTDDDPPDALSSGTARMALPPEVVTDGPVGSATALDAFRESVETMRLRDHVARTRQTGVIGAPDTELRVYAGQWHLARTVDGAWRMQVGEEKWTTGPDMSLAQLEEKLFDHAMARLTGRAEA